MIEIGSNIAADWNQVQAAINASPYFDAIDFGGGNILNFDPNNGNIADVFDLRESDFIFV